jgi:signal peptidase II
MRVLWLTGLVIALDQISKMIVLRTMYLGQQIPVLGNWLKLTYTENPGMAFGITFGPKSLVTVFSIIATALISFYLYKVRNGYSPYRASLALILGGAIGNIIDRVFYGALFGDGSFFVGRVVDFIHVNIWSGFIPESVPVIGGTYVSLFPIWNVADMAIVCGVVGILVFQKVYHRQIQEQEEERGLPVGGTTGLDPELVPYSAAGEASPEGYEDQSDPSRTDYTSP